MARRLVVHRATPKVVSSKMRQSCCPISCYAGRYPDETPYTRVSWDKHLQAGSSPWVVEVALSSFNEKDLEVVVQVRKSSSDNATMRGQFGCN